VTTGWRPTLADFVETAAVILDVPPQVVERLPGLSRADSALHAPFAEFGGEQPYRELIDRAAVLIERLARNHPLPDGNKRAALGLTILFLERNGKRWGKPDHDRDVGMVERIADGEAQHHEIRDWIAERVGAGRRKRGT
jgi:death-on-curing protein